MLDGVSFLFFFFQAEDGIRDAQESRGLGDVYKRQHEDASSLGRITLPDHPLFTRPNRVESLSGAVEYDLSLIHI